MAVSQQSWPMLRSVVDVDAFSAGIGAGGE
jgi:hypothetical protein